MPQIGHRVAPREAGGGGQRDRPDDLGGHVGRDLEDDLAVPARAELAASLGQMRAEAGVDDAPAHGEYLPLAAGRGRSRGLSHLKRLLAGPRRRGHRKFPNSCPWTTDQRPLEGQETGAAPLGAAPFRRPVPAP